MASEIGRCILDSASPLLGAFTSGEVNLSSRAGGA